MSEHLISLGQIIAAVEAATGLTRREIVSDRRPPELVGARLAVFWLASKLTVLSTPQLGRVMRRDHTTVLHSIRQAEQVRGLDPEFRAATDALLVSLLELERAGQLRLAAAIDPVDTARRVLARPEREAARVSTAEIIALCQLALALADDDRAEPSPASDPMETEDAA